MVLMMVMVMMMMLLVINVSDGEDDDDDGDDIFGNDVNDGDNDVYDVDDNDDFQNKYVNISHTVSKPIPCIMYTTSSLATFPDALCAYGHPPRPLTEASIVRTPSCVYYKGHHKKHYMSLCIP